jgi:glycosyltransferase involved in cell wall biosynthesis
VASVSLRDINSARNLWHLDASKFYWLPNAVDIEKFKVNPIDIKSQRLSVIFIARLEMWKGIDTLLEVAKIVGNEMEEVEFIIIGDGSLKRYIETVKARFNKNIKVVGQVSPEFIPEILANASVLILPSYMEGLPTVGLEALACEVPAVASNVGGVPEIIKDGETGYLFPAGDAQMCADRILKLLSNDKLRKMMGRNGRRLVKSIFSWEKVVEKTERIYDIMGDR